MTLDEVYEKFKHLDLCLSSIEKCNNDALDGSLPEFIYGIAGELWQAIKIERASHSSASAEEVPEELDIWIRNVPGYPDQHGRGNLIPTNWVTERLSLMIEGKV